MVLNESLLWKNQLGNPKDIVGELVVLPRGAADASNGTSAPGGLPPTLVCGNACSMAQRVWSGEENQSEASPSTRSVLSDLSHELDGVYDDDGGFKSLNLNRASLKKLQEQEIELEKNLRDALDSAFAWMSSSLEMHWPSVRNPPGSPPTEAPQDGHVAGEDGGGEDEMTCETPKVKIHHDDTVAKDRTSPLLVKKKNNKNKATPTPMLGVRHRGRPKGSTKHALHLLLNRGKPQSDSVQQPRPDSAAMPLVPAQGEHPIIRRRVGRPSKALKIIIKPHELGGERGGNPSPTRSAKALEQGDLSPNPNPNPNPAGEVISQPSPSPLKRDKRDTVSSPAPQLSASEEPSDLLMQDSEDGRMGIEVNSSEPENSSSLLGVITLQPYPFPTTLPKKRRSWRKTKSRFLPKAQRNSLRP